MDHIFDSQILGRLISTTDKKLQANRYSKELLEKIDLLDEEFLFARIK